MWVLYINCKFTLWPKPGSVLYMHFNSIARKSSGDIRVDNRSFSSVRFTQLFLPALVKIQWSSADWLENSPLEGPGTTNLCSQRHPLIDKPTVSTFLYKHLLFVHSLHVIFPFIIFPKSQKPVLSIWPVTLYLLTLRGLEENENFVIWDSVHWHECGKDLWHCQNHPLNWMYLIKP